MDDGVYTLSTGVKTASTPDKITDYYLPTIVSYSDYDPFGTMQSLRNSGENYHYGFQGMERDDEVKQNGNSYTTEFRQYDPRLGRWLTLDPLMQKYPGMSPYISFNDNPIYFADPAGLEGGPATPVSKALKEISKGIEDGVYDLTQLAASIMETNLDEVIITYTYPKGVFEGFREVKTIGNQKIFVPNDTRLNYTRKGKVLKSFSYANPKSRGILSITKDVIL